MGARARRSEGEANGEAAAASARPARRQRRAEANGEPQQRARGQREDKGTVKIFANDLEKMVFKIALVAGKVRTRNLELQGRLQREDN